MTASTPPCVRHFFIRDRVLGIIPVGKPYCMWCGKVAGA